MRLNSKKKIESGFEKTTPSEIGLVVIGRNEESRLPASLQILRDIGVPLVYVDSRSTDRSIDVARSMGIETLVLGDDRPVNAARARNVGADWLLAHFPQLQYMQFVDGDTMLYPEWLATAIKHLDLHPDVGFVCGQLREKDRDSNMYRRLCDMEWCWMATDSAVPSSLGGIGLMRVSAFRRVNGFDETLITGEDPELYGRLVADGWKLHVLSIPMGLHDSGMVAFRQWWIRAVKSGFSFANSQDSSVWQRERRSTVLWGGILPLIALLGAILVDVRFLAMLLAFPLNVCRIRASSAKQEFSSFDRWLYAGACMLMKIPQCVGIAKFYWRKRTGHMGLLIQYK